MSSIQETLDGLDNLPPVAPCPDVGSQRPGVSSGADRASTEEGRGASARRPQLFDRPPDLGVEAQCGRGDSNSHQPVRFVSDLSQRIDRGIRSEFGNVEASPAQEVSHHGHRQCVQISRGSSNDDRATTSAPPPELEAEATDDALRHGRRSVLVGDAHIAVGPFRRRWIEVPGRGAW